MNFENYTVIPNVETHSTALFLATENEIRDGENVLNIQLDNDYKEYVLTYGSGILGGTYVRIYLPDRVTKTLSDWRERIDTYWLWNDPQSVLTKNEVLSSIRVGDTFDGDELIFFKSEYFILPRYSRTIHSIGNTLEESITWLCSSGILTEPFAERNFEPFDPAEWKD